MAAGGLWHTISCMLPRRHAQPDVADSALAGVVTTIIAVEEGVPAGYRSALPDDVLPWTAVLCPLSGVARVTVAGATHRLAPGSLALLPAGCGFIEEVGDRPWDLCYLLLVGDLADRLASTLRALPGGGLVQARPATAWRDAVVTTVRAVLDGAPGWDWQVFALFGRLGLGVHQAAPAGLTGQVLQRLELEPDAVWSIAYLAEACGMGVSAFAHRFRQETGTSPQAWVRRWRMTRARRLLDQGYSVVEVADRMGFSSAFAFSRTYLAVMGLRPSLQRGGGSGLHRH